MRRHRQRRLTAALLLAATLAGSTAQADADEALSADLMDRIERLVHPPDAEPYENGATGLAVGAHIVVIDDVQYHYPDHPENNYRLTAGTSGSVVQVDTSGDADVRWDRFGRRWLLHSDFGKVKVELPGVQSPSQAQAEATSRIIGKEKQGTLGTWFDRELGDNYNEGIYFQVQAAEDMAVTALVGNLRGPGNVNVYMRQGELGIVPGHGWTRAVSVTALEGGMQQLKFKPFHLARGNHSFLMSCTGRLMYGNSLSAGEVSARDDHLIIYAGHATSDLSPEAGHGYSWQGRHWDGIFQYKFTELVRVLLSTTTVTRTVTTTLPRVTTTSVTTTTATSTTTDLAGEPTVRLSMVAPVYDFWGSGIRGDSFHMMPAWEREQPLSVQFYALKQKAQYSAPVNTFWHGLNEEYTFHLGDAWEGETPVGEVAFWAFREQLAGTEPVYDYWSDHRKHTFHMGDAWDGEVIGDVQFYAFPDGHDDDIEDSIERCAQEERSRVQAALRPSREESHQEPRQEPHQEPRQESHREPHQHDDGQGSGKDSGRDECPGWKAPAEEASAAPNAADQHGNDPRPVYDYFHQGRHEHSIRMGGPRRCEVRRGTLFWAFREPGQGLAPVYAQSDAEACTVGLGESCDGGGPLFYTFQSQAPGTVPVYNTWEVREGDKVLFYAVGDAELDDVRRYAHMAREFGAAPASRLFDDHLVGDAAPSRARWSRASLIAVAAVGVACAGVAFTLAFHRRRGTPRIPSMEDVESRSLMVGASDLRGARPAPHRPAPPRSSRFVPGAGP